MNLPSRLDLANLREETYVDSLLHRIYSPEFHIWFDVLQNAAEGLRDSQPEDLQRNTNTFESACQSMSRYLGLAPEIEKEEDDKPRMKCVKCDALKTGDVCDCGSNGFVQVEPGDHVWL